MKQSPELHELAAALVAAQKDMPSIEKDATGHGYKYASLDQIMSKVRPVLAEHGLVIVQHPTSQDADGMGLTTRLLHTSGQYLEEVVYAPRDDGQRRNSVQAAGSTITYLKRYGIAALLGLADESDTDGTPPPTRNKTKQQPSQDTRGATSPQKQAKRKRPSKNGGAKPFYATVRKDIKYFTADNHVKHTMNLLDIEYPQDAAAAKHALATLAQYATLRADGTEQEKAVKLLHGELALDREEE